MCIQEYVAAVAQDQTAAAEKAAMLMSATRGAHAGVGSEYVIEPPSTLTAEDSDNGSEGRMMMTYLWTDRQVHHEWMMHSELVLSYCVCVTEAHRGGESACHVMVVVGSMWLACADAGEHGINPHNPLPPHPPPPPLLP